MAGSKRLKTTLNLIESLYQDRIHKTTYLAQVKARVPADLYLKIRDFAGLGPGGNAGRRREWAVHYRVKKWLNMKVRKRNKIRRWHNLIARQSLVYNRRGMDYP